MSIITPSDTALAYLAQLTIGQQRFDISEMSETTGHTATRLGGPPRWTAALRTLDAMEPAVSALWKAIAVQLRGRVNHLALYDVSQPQPRGSARGTITLASTASAGATSLSLAGCRSGSNLYLNGGFEIDTDANGVADGWTAYFNSVTGQSYSRTDGNGSLWSQVCFAASLGPGSGSQVGVARGLEPVTPGAAYSLSCDAVANYTTLNVWLYVAWYTAGGVFISDSSSATPGPATFQRLSMSATAPPTATQAISYIWAAGTGTTLSNAQIYIDNVQFEQAAAATAYSGPATLRAGDWLQIGSGVGSHYCMVVADATATDAGAITVTVEPPLRKAFTSGTAVTWDKPRGHFKQRPDAVSWSGVAGGTGAGDFAFDLMEDWTA